MDLIDEIEAYRNYGPYFSVIEAFRETSYWPRIRAALAAMKDENERLRDELSLATRQQVQEREAWRAECDALRRDYETVKNKAQRQRTELRRLNKLLGPYWLGFRAGFAKESELKLRVAMNRAFGYEAVRKAEHDAIDVAMKDEK